MAVVLAANVTLTGMVIQQTRQKHYPFWAPSAGLASWASYEEVFTWLRNNTQADEVSIAGLDSMI